MEENESMETVMTSSQLRKPSTYGYSNKQHNIEQAIVPSLVSRRRYERERETGVES